MANSMHQRHCGKGISHVESPAFQGPLVFANNLQYPLAGLCQITQLGHLAPQLVVV
jgi:hypothetical protein